MRTHSMKLESLAAVALAGCAAMYAPHATAQARDAQRCAAIENDAQRLECYDRALRPAPTATEAPKASASPSAAPTSTIATEDRGSRRERRARESGAPAAPGAPARPAAVDPVAPAPAPAPVARAAPEANAATEVRHAGRGPNEAETATLVPVVIVQIRSLPGRPVTFVADNGESWVQTDNERQMPAVPFKAAIKPGSMSSLFLVPEDYAHSFRVRPAK